MSEIRTLSTVDELRALVAEMKANGETPVFDRGAAYGPDVPSVVYAHTDGQPLQTRAHFPNAVYDEFMADVRAATDEEVAAHLA